MPLTQRCPRCHAKAPRRWWLPSQWWIWSTWVCAGCGARLKLSFRRRITLVVPFLAVIAGLYAAALVFQKPLLMAAAGLGSVALGIATWRGDRAVVVCDGPFCPGCGYDLSGLPPGAACPECGKAA